MTNLKKEEIGKISEVVKNYENGKAFLHDLLGLTSCEISVSTMTLDNEVVEIKEGSCVKVLPNAVRTMEAKTDLEYICVQAKSNSLEQFGLSDAELC